MGKSKRAERSWRIPTHDSDDLAVPHPNAAGIDIGAREIWVSVPPSRAPEGKSIRTFGTLTGEVREMADWLRQCGVTTAALESTGVYWVPIYEILAEHGIEPWLVNSFEAKSVPGRKSDVLDCQWLRKLHAHGLLRRSFRPEAEMVEFRQYLRLRNDRVQTTADCVRRMQKALTLMSVHLHLVVSDIAGITGMAIIRAIVGGERDPDVLAANRQPGCRRSIDQIRAALVGNYQPEHLFALAQELETYDLAMRQTADCEQRAQQLLTRLQPAAAPDVNEPPKKKRKPKAHAATVDFATPLRPLLGTDITAIPGFADYTAAVFISEVGTDMTRWPTANHFTSWLRLCPRTDITGGKSKSRRPLPTTSRATNVLRMAATNAGRTDTAIGAFYRSMASRKGKQQAVVATARKLAVIAYTIIRNGISYRDTNAATWETVRQERELKNLQKRAGRLGLTLIQATPVVATSPS